MTTRSTARRRRARKAAASDSESDSGTSFSPANTPSKSSSKPKDLPERVVLTRRISKKGHSYAVQAPGEEYDDLDPSQVPFLHSNERDEESRPFVRYRRAFFLIGILLGGLAMFLVSGHQNLDAHVQLALSRVEEQFGLDLKNFSMANFGQYPDLTDIGDRIFSSPKEWLKAKDFSVGRDLAAKGYKAHYPVVLVPGIISTGLESWSTDENLAGVFRKRLWGTSTMMRTIVFDKDGWVNQIQLDEETGLDPPGVRVRAAEGLDAADYFITGYWIWSKVIENLAAIGYDTNNLHLAAYDWRLSMYNLEERDHFFSRLKRHIETNKEILGRKTVLVSHSMGTTVIYYFLKWVEASGPKFGNGGPQWVEDHIEAFTSIAGTWLGVPKAMAALFTGEMRDTVELPSAAAYLLEKFFSREERVRLFRSWAGSSCMLIKGGEAIWGGPEGAPDDLDPSVAPNSTALGGGEWNAENITQSPSPAPPESFGNIYSFRASPPPTAEDKEALGPYAVERNISAQDSLDFLLSHAPGWYRKSVANNYTNGIEYDEEQVKWNGLHDPRTWTNPLESPLPNAPSMKVICLYGEGKPTERAYYIEHGPFEQPNDAVSDEALDEQCENCSTANGTTFAGDSILQPLPRARPAWIDSSVHTLGSGEGLGTRAGCRLGEGDGTVSLVSLGSMCVEGWKRKRYNPAGVQVITHEMKHQPDVLDLRGGTTTGDHVDILGSWSVNDAVLKVAAGKGDQIDNVIYSKIRDYAKKMFWDNPPPSRR